MTLSVHVSGDAYHLGERDWLYLGQVLWFSFFLQYFYFREFSSVISSSVHVHLGPSSFCCFSFCKERIQWASGAEKGCMLTCDQALALVL